MGCNQSCCGAGDHSEVIDVDDLKAEPIGVDSVDEFVESFNTFLEGFGDIVDSINEKREALGAALKLSKVEARLKLSLTSMLLSFLSTARGDASKVKPSIDIHALMENDYQNAFNVSLDGSDFKESALDQIDALRAYMVAIAETVTTKGPESHENLEALVVQGQNILSNISNEVSDLDMVSSQCRSCSPYFTPWPY
jgi:hypothetical protein